MNANKLKMNASGLKMNAKVPIIAHSKIES
jgi:hypothetical protein